jgi:hypothetical protein
MTAEIDPTLARPEAPSAPGADRVVEPWMIEVDEEAQNERRRLVKRAQKALEAARAVYADLGIAERPSVLAMFTALDAEAEREKPPEPRRCKEYLRAVTRAKKGLMGISPDHVVFYCRCVECTAIRAKERLVQPELHVVPSPAPESSPPVVADAG